MKAVKVAWLAQQLCLRNLEFRIRNSEVSHHLTKITTEHLPRSKNLVAYWQSRSSKNYSEWNSFQNVETPCQIIMLLDCQLNVHGTLHGNRIHIFRDVDCGSQTAVSNIVPKSSENVNKETISFTTPPTSSVEPPGLDTSINNEQIIKISGLDGVRPRLLEALISDRASNFISSTKRQGSSSNYNSSLLKESS